MPAPSTQLRRTAPPPAAPSPCALFPVRRPWPQWTPHSLKRPAEYNKSRRTQPPLRRLMDASSCAWRRSLRFARPSVVGRSNFRLNEPSTSQCTSVGDVRDKRRGRRALAARSCCSSLAIFSAAMASALSCGQTPAAYMGVPTDATGHVRRQRSITPRPTRSTTPAGPAEPHLDGCACVSCP